MVSSRRIARLEAIIVLYKAGWTSEKIALALTISRATIEREIVKDYRINLAKKTLAFI